MPPPSGCFTVNIFNCQFRVHRPTLSGTEVNRHVSGAKSDEEDIAKRMLLSNPWGSFRTLTCSLKTCIHRLTTAGSLKTYIHYPTPTSFLISHFCIHHLTSTCSLMTYLSTVQPLPAPTITTYFCIYLNSYLLLMDQFLYSLSSSNLYLYWLASLFSIEVPPKWIMHHVIMYLLAAQYVFPLVESTICISGTPSHLSLSLTPSLSFTSRPIQRG